MKFFSQKILALSFVGAMFMVAMEVSPWIAIFSFGVLFWKWGVEKYSWKPMPKRVSGVLSVLLLGQVLLQYRTLIGQEPAYTFLLGLSALRAMDYSGPRDHKFIVLLGFLLVSIKALFSVDIYWAAPSLLIFFGLWYSLASVSMPSKGKSLLKIMILSIPLTVVLFVAFPRVVMPWAMSRGGALGQIGFTDEINPGRVAEIAATAQLAFRAKLTELPLKKSESLYWRGVVLTQSRGLSWRQGLGAYVRQDRTDPVSGLPYEVALEPTGQNYLFTLDGTTRVDMDAPSVIDLENSVFRASRLLSASVVYRGYWSSRYEEKEDSPQDFVNYPVLQGRVLTWVKDVHSSTTTEQEKLDRLRALFSESGFVYSLKPGVYTNEDLESFLFERKVGFCEHYAGAYATLARALGIPARVVVGYQGGIYNPLGGFWKVGQKDAHAWVEIVQNGVWRRVDPTVWVAPLRLIIGAEAFFELSEADQKAFARSPQWRPPVKDTWGWAKDISFWIEDLNYRWSYFLIEFDKTAQQSVWRDLLQNRSITAVFMVLVVVGMFFIFRSLYRGPQNFSVQQRFLIGVETWGIQHQLSRQRQEPPLSYFHRLQEQFPALASVLTKAGEVYDKTVYRGENSEEWIGLHKEWRKVIRSQAMQIGNLQKSTKNQKSS